MYLANPTYFDSTHIIYHEGLTVLSEAVNDENKKFHYNSAALSAKQTICASVTSPKNFRCVRSMTLQCLWENNYRICQ